jgi:uncharacterized membrane protein
MTFSRLLKHATTPRWLALRSFTPAVLDRIEAAVKASESTHRAELRFAAEGDLDLLPLLRGQTPRDRAVAVFSKLRVWDTAENNGVLIYVQCVDRAIEIVADRGIAAQVPQTEWDAICRQMEAAFREGRYDAGAVAGIEAITALLARHFPPGPANPDELPDRPVLL